MLCHSGVFSRFRAYVNVSTLFERLLVTLLLGRLVLFFFT